MSLFLHRDFTVGVFHARPHRRGAWCFGLATGVVLAFRCLARIVGDGET